MKVSHLGRALGLGFLVLVFGSCELLTPNEPKASPTPAPTVTLTTAGLVGTWKGGSTTAITGSTTGSSTSSTTWVFSADSSYIEKQVYSSTVAGVTSTTYADEKGTYSANAGALTLVETASRYASTAFTNDTTGWITNSTPLTVTMPRGLYNGKLYSVFTAEGPTSGLVGKWVSMTTMSPSSKPNRKFEVIFGSDGKMTSNDYSSATTTFSTTPDSSSVATYTSTSTTMTQSSTRDGTTGTSTGEYVIVGSNLLVGPMTKQ